MILIGTKLLISYIPYEYKDGGFFITISPDNKIRYEVLDAEPFLSPLKYHNETPNYYVLLDRYFTQLKNELDECFKLH